jgi:hypothetical protein
MAKEAATQVTELLQIYPEVKVGQVDPVGVIPTDNATYADGLSTWIKAYERATSRKLAFFDLDVAWPMPPAQSQLRTAVNVVRRAGIPLGVILNGTRADDSDEAWITSARKHIRLIESVLSGPPDRAIFETWTDHPRRILPEDGPNTLTGLVKEYISSHN